MAIEKAIPLGLITNELVNNSLKHAFTNNEEGIININFSEDGSAFHFEVNDNGAGLENKGYGKSLGLRLVSLLVRQLKGEFQISNQNGTKAKVLFPLN